MKTLSTIIASLAILLAGCYADNGEDLYNCSAAPATITYSSTVTSILTTNGCTGCHSGTFASGGVNLSSHAGVKSEVTSGRLWGAVNHLEGYKPMPQGGGKISTCDIKRLKAWIDAGAPGN